MVRVRAEVLSATFIRDFAKEIYIFGDNSGSAISIVSTYIAVIHTTWVSIKHFDNPVLIRVVQNKQPACF